MTCDPSPDHHSDDTEEINTTGLAHVPDGYDDELYRLRHSAAHVLAEAIQRYFEKKGPVSFGIGPPTADGFFYDFVLPEPLSVAQLPKIEKLMRRILKEGSRFSGTIVSEGEARTQFADQPFKLELIAQILAGNTGDAQGEGAGQASGVSPDSSAAADSNKIPEGGADASGAARLSIFRQGGFVDLCRGPHVATAAKIRPDAFRLTNVSGAHWKGDSANAAMTRIHGVLFKSAEDLAQYEWRRAEAEKRDHRRIGKQLRLFHFDDTAPGMPYWLPGGLHVLNTLIDYWRQEHERRDYFEIATPLINRKELWEKSGHWEHYRDDMFMIPIDENNTYAVKPMNCPNAMIVFNTEIRSYRDLPLRLSDSDQLHRNEASGALHGLLRVQSFRQDDAHVFVRESQIESECAEILSICDQFYGVFGFNFRLRLGTRPDDFLGDIESWNTAEAALARILRQRTGGDNFEIAEKDGAFYGPKIDIVMEDAIGREWQMGTIQLDFQLPRRFDCTYIDEAGERRTPVVIHRAVYGSLERFIGLLIEQYSGAFPLWIAPVQARIITIATRHGDYGRTVRQTLRDAGIRAELDAGNERMNAKIRTAQMQKIPYILVVGDAESESGSVAVRLRDTSTQFTLPVAELVDHMRAEIRSRQIRSLDPSG